MRRPPFWLLIVVALACASCGRRLCSVSGRVTYKGAPASGAAVFLRSHGEQRLSDQLIMGIVQPDGSFTVVCGTQGEGAPPGTYDVLIQWRQQRNASKGSTHPVADVLAGRYADPQHPRFQAVISPGRNLLPTFDLTD
jgi:hypothetical protein